MSNETNREYDYSSLYNGTTPPAPDTGYVNVGSSGTNTANTADSFDGAPSGQSEGSSYVPPVPPVPPADAQPADPVPPAPKKKPRRFARGIAALAACAVVGLVSGLAGGYLAGANAPRIVMQTVERSSSDSASATSTSTGGSDLTLAQVSAVASPSVVVITTEEVVYSSWSWYGPSQVQSGAGSGIILSEDGYILTCAHVIEGASNITVTIGDTDYTATVIGSDSTSDVAVVKIDATGLTPVTLGDSNTLAVGEEVIAVGNPLGELGGTVTNGIISALNRSISIEGSGSTVTMSLIQTNASVSPGNSGGGLFNMAGELVGMVNAKSADSEAEGLGFAIPINDAIAVVEDLMENGYVTGRPYLGITYIAVTDSSTAQQLGVPAYGIYVVEVVEGGPADRAGLEPGDRIVSVDNTEIVAQDDLGTLIQSHQAGDVISITLARDGQMMTFEVTLGEQNAPTN